MKDPAHKETDKLLEEMERRIAKEYKQAEEEVAKKLDDYLKRFETKDKTWQRWVQEGKKTEKEYKEWKTGQIAIGERWEEMRAVLAEDYHNANLIAKSVINGYMPEVYAINHNYGAYEIEHGLKVDTSYTLYDRQTVENLLKDGKKLYHDPGKDVSKKIAAGIDLRWNKQQIQSVMLQSILQGEAIPKIADRLSKAVGDSNRAAAIRNARTMATGVENAGRVDSYKRAEKMGIELGQQWIATLDNRTRHSHRLLDGEIQKVGDEFSNGCKYPGDPDGDPAEIYNCRCTLIASIKGYENDLSALGLRNVDHLGNMTYDEWKKAKSVSQSITAPEEKAENFRQKYLTEYIQGPQVKPFESAKLKNVLGSNYGEFREKIDESPAKPLYNSYIEECKEIKEQKSGGWYRAASDQIVFSYETKEGLDKYSVLAHECGHMFDSHIGSNDNLHFNEVKTINSACKIGTTDIKLLKELPSQSDEFLSALRADMDALRDKVKNRSIRDELLATKETKNSSNGVQDAIDGFFSTQSNHILPWGHGDKYYNRGYNRRVKGFDVEKSLKGALNDLGFDASNQAKVKRLYRTYETASEAFANVNAAVTVGGKELEAIEKYMPKTLEAYKKIIEVL